MRKRDKLRKKQAKIEIRSLLIKYRKALQRADATYSDQDLGRVAIMEIVLPFKLGIAEMQLNAVATVYKKNIHFSFGNLKKEYSGL
ncbi:hypothetical protein NSA03_02710 [Lactobacillus taiwanensis]|uniref:hypothetical protein n=1 Tax=Lactobacillus TaxID=1578 RepID=UPI00214B6867|nr:MULTISPECIES: hypothetical protein [Lactobacillus]MCR1916229.1 hypothetical protein [Lactobacillus taiwanensis]MDE7050400.1 hypothetical protein [Lactobacillus sp.]